MLKQIINLFKNEDFKRIPIPFLNPIKIKLQYNDAYLKVELSNGEIIEDIFYTDFSINEDYVLEIVTGEKQLNDHNECIMWRINKDNRCFMKHSIVTKFVHLIKKEIEMEINQSHYILDGIEYSVLK